MPEADEPRGSEQEENQQDFPEDISPEDLAREVMAGLDEEDEIAADSEETSEPQDLPEEGLESGGAEESSAEKELSPDEDAAEQEVPPPASEDQAESQEEQPDPAEEESKIYEDSEELDPTEPESEEVSAREDIAEQPQEDPPDESVEEPGEETEEQTDKEKKPESDQEEVDVVEDIDEEELAPEELEEPMGQEDVEEEAQAGKGSIKDILAQEAERSRDVEEEEEEEEEKKGSTLPGGYLTGDQLPEEEEVLVPEWLKETAHYTFVVVIIFIFIWQVFWPGVEAFLTSRINTAFEEEELGMARFYSRLGLFLNGIFIKNPEDFRGDYLKQILDRQEFAYFLEEYENLTYEPPQPRSLQVYAQYLINQGRMREALPLLEELQIPYYTRGIGYLLEVRARIALKQYTEAQGALERAWRWLPENIELDRLERDLALALDELDRAALAGNRVLNRLSEENRFEVRARDYVQLGRIAERRNQFRTAEEMYTQAVGLEPRHRDSRAFLIRHFVLQERWLMVREYLEGARAEHDFRKLYPLDPLGWWAGAELELRDDEIGRSILLLERARALDAREPEIYRLLGTIYLDDFQEASIAVNYLETARGFGLDRDDFFNYLARAYFSAEQFLEAVDVYRIVQDRLEENPAALWYNIGSCYLGAGQLDEAETYLMRAYRDGYRQAEFYTQSGLLYELRGQHQEALARYMEGIEIMEADEEDVERLRRNLNRALARQPVSPITEWLAPLEKDLSN